MDIKSNKQYIFICLTIYCIGSTRTNLNTFKNIRKNKFIKTFHVTVFNQQTHQITSILICSVEKNI